MSIYCRHHLKLDRMSNMFMREKRRAVLIFGILLFANIIAWGVVHEMTRPMSMEVIFFDVGQGDATLIKTPEGHRIIIDGGPDSSILEKLSAEIPFWEREIDLIVLTHPHADHMNGLIDILERYEVRSVLWTGVSDEGASFAKWKEVISGTDILIARAGQRVRGDTFRLDILYPFVSLEGEAVGDLNTTSIVARLVSADGSYFFTGDAYASNERELIEAESRCIKDGSISAVCRVMVLDSDVLKVGHHGSKTSTSREFLEAVAPSIAVISSGGNNRYGHPHPETLEALADYGIRILRTDTDGDVKVVPGG